MKTLGDRVWRPHRFINTTLTPDTELVLLWPEFSIGIIDTVIMVGVTGDDITAFLTLNGSAVQTLIIPGTGGETIATNLVYNQIAIPVFYQDVLRASVGFGGMAAQCSFLVTGRVSGWTGAIPTDGLG